MRLRNMWVGTLGLALAASVACGGGKAPESAAPAAPPPAAAGGQKVDPATAGDVKGVVTLDGTAPKNEPIKMNADPVCVKDNRRRSSRKPTSSAATASSATCSST